jgi:phosphoenolpyruvate carboxylase
VVDDIEAQLARTDLAIAGRYADLASAAQWGYLTRLEAEYSRCREAVLGIKDQTELLDGDATQQRAAGQEA